MNISRFTFKVLMICHCALILKVNIFSIHFLYVLFYSLFFLLVCLIHVKS